MVWFWITLNMDWRLTIGVDRKPSSEREPILRPRIPMVICGVKHW